MNLPDFDSVLDDCVARLQGGASVLGCAAQYPRHAAALQPLLAVAAEARSLPAPRARPQAVRMGRERMLAAVAQAYPATPVSSESLLRYAERILTTLTPLKDNPMGFVLRTAFGLVMTFLLTSVVAVTAAEDSLPGDGLYGVKRAWEGAELAFTLDPHKRETLEAQQALERRREVSELLALHRSARVDFAAMIEAMQVKQWTVGGLLMYLNEQTVVQGAPAVGDPVRITADIHANGALVAVRLAVPSKPIPVPCSDTALCPTRTPTPTPVPTATPTAHGCNDAAHCPTPTATPCPSNVKCVTRTPVERCRNSAKCPSPTPTGCNDAIHCATATPRPSQTPCTNAACAPTPTPIPCTLGVNCPTATPTPKATATVVPCTSNVNCATPTRTPCAGSPNCATPTRTPCPNSNCVTSTPLPTRTPIATLCNDTVRCPTPTATPCNDVVKCATPTLLPTHPPTSTPCPGSDCAPSPTPCSNAVDCGTRWPTPTSSAPTWTPPPATTAATVIPCAGNLGCLTPPPSGTPGIATPKP